jgi:hypothetical protein
MAGIGFVGTVFKFGPTGSEQPIKHVTGYSLNVSTSEVTQIVADQADALAMLQAPVKSWNISFAVPEDIAAAQMNMLDAGQTGSLVVELHDDLNGTLIATWESLDDQCEAGGCAINGGGTNFTTASVTISTNGGVWS